MRRLNKKIEWRKTMKNEINDLMSLRDLALKHGYDYNYLYKISVTLGLVNVYHRGIWMLSEAEVLDYSRKSVEKRLNKLRLKKVG